MGEGLGAPYDRTLPGLSEWENHNRFFRHPPCPFPSTAGGRKSTGISPSRCRGRGAERPPCPHPHPSPPPLLRLRARGREWPAGRKRRIPRGMPGQGPRKHPGPPAGYPPRGYRADRGEGRMPKGRPRDGDTLTPAVGHRGRRASNTPRRGCRGQAPSICRPACLMLS